MTSLSFPIIRAHYPPFTPPSRFRTVSIAVSRNRETVMKKAKQHLRNSRDAVKLNGDDNLRLTPDQAVGRVVSAQANFMRVVIKSNKLNKSNKSEHEGYGLELLCSVRSLLKKIERRVIVGDTVLVRSIDWINRSGMIENVFERRTEVTDPPVANVDRLLVLFSFDEPKLEAKTLTRFLVEAESTKLPFTLALNKAELVENKTVIKWKAILCSWGYEPIICSVETKTGLDSLQFKLRDQTSVIMGPSGVGKSSLINALRSSHSGFGSAEADDWPNSISGSKWLEDQRVGEVSARNGKGKQTTRHVSLLPLSGGGYVADTPGFNQLTLLKVSQQSLALYFPEVGKILSDNQPSKCEFSNCLHVEEPGCLVKPVWCLEKPEWFLVKPAWCLEKPEWHRVKPKWKRYKYYFQLLEEIRIRVEFKLRTLGTKREGDVRFKMGDMGIKQAEPRLDPKKHRRQSRKTTNQSIINDLENELEDDNDASYLDDDPVIRAMENEKQ